MLRKISTTNSRPRCCSLTPGWCGLTEQPRQPVRGRPTERMQAAGLRMLIQGQTETTNPPTSRDSFLIDVIVSKVESEAEGTNSYELRRPANKWLPTVDPGAHVDVH